MGNFTYRIAPCPYYDTKTMEVWLEEMAEKGLILGDEGIFPGMIAFQKSRPQSIRYRLIASEHSYRKSRAYRYAPVPDEQTQTFYKEFGWYYIATRRDFHIYACTDPNAPEMQTDPRVQAMAYDHAIRREKVDILGYSLLAAINGFLLLWQLYDFLIGNSLRLSLYHGWLSLMWLFFLVPHIRSWHQLRLMQKILREGSPLPPSQGYRKTAPGYRLTLAGKVLLISVFFLTVFHAPSSVYHRQEWTPLSEYTGEIPFATMEELLPEARLREDVAWGNEILTTSTPLADTWQLNQQLHITLADGTQTSGTLKITRRHTKIASIAHRQALKAFSREEARDHNPVLLSIDGIDYGFYSAARTHDYVVLQKDNMIITVDFKIYSADPITAAQIAEIMYCYLIP